MADDFTRLNLGAGGDAMDESGVTYASPPTTRKRARVVISGETQEELVVVKNTDCDATDYGLVVRNLPSAMPHPGEPITEFGEATLVAYDVETTIVTYTVPTDQIFYVTGFIGSGDINGRFRLYVDGSVIIQGRTTAAELNVQMNTGLVRPWASESQIVSLKVIHSQSGLTPNFDGTILGYVVDEDY